MTLSPTDGEMILLLVESPAKARRLEALLGAEYLVRATRGHVKDLPRRGLGLTRDHHAVPRYRTLPSFRKELAALRSEAHLVSEIWIATDPDREGELIAHHIGGLLAATRKPMRRLLIHDLTAEGVRRAIEGAGAIDRRVAEAQMARRTIDRLVGYTISPQLTAATNGRRTVSTGRVQAAALTLVSAREGSSTQQSPERWRIHIPARDVSGRPFDAVSSTAFANRALAEGAAAELEGRSLRVRDVLNARDTLPAPPPLATHSLIALCSERFGYSASTTMRAAQQLYQGVGSETGPTGGLISYPRSESDALSPEDADAAYIQARQRFGAPERRAATARDAQAHGAIRPSDPSLHPDDVRRDLSAEQYRVYETVWKRTLASQMSAATFACTHVVLEEASGASLYEAGWRRCVEPGYLRCEPDPDRHTQEPSPDLQPGDTVRLGTPHLVHEQALEPLYTEGTLVAELHRRGIGRAATYGRIVESLVDGGLVERTPDGLRATRLGNWVNGQLERHFARLTGLEATARIEEAVESIAGGQSSYEEVVETFIRDYVMPSLDAAQGNPAPDGAKRPGSTARPEAECPECGLPLVRRTGRFGAFLGCVGYPRCRYTRPIGS